MMMMMSVRLTLGFPKFPKWRDLYEFLKRAEHFKKGLPRDARNIWKDKYIRIKHNIRLMRALVITIFLYACETWTLTAELQRRIQSLEFRCFRKILGISYKDRITNEQVRKTIITHIGPYEYLLATVKRRKLKWYGHVTRSDGLTKVILQGTVEGSRRRGRPKKSWIDNIADWTGKSFAETQTMTHNRQEWRTNEEVRHDAPPTVLRGAKGPRQGYIRSFNLIQCKPSNYSAYSLHRNKGDAD